ncbi:MAG: hypothetical protein WCK43_05930, partial [bacterium]
MRSKKLFFDLFSFLIFVSCSNQVLVQNDSNPITRNIADSTTPTLISYPSSLIASDSNTTLTPTPIDKNALEQNENISFETDYPLPAYLSIDEKTGSLSFDKNKLTKIHEAIQDYVIIIKSNGKIIGQGKVTIEIKEPTSETHPLNPPKISYSSPQSFTQGVTI